MEIPKFRFRHHASAEATPAPPDGGVSAQESAERLKQRISPVVARIIASTEDKSFLNPGYKNENALEIATLAGVLTDKKPTDIPYAQLETVSKDSRSEYWKKRGGSFEDQKNQWNNHVSMWIEKNAGEQGQNHGEVRAALQSLGIEVDNNTNVTALPAKVEKFRTDYLDKKSDIKQFVADIAKGCRTGEVVRENDQDIFIVDRAQLQTRLTAVKALLGSFGDTDGIPELVAEYATAHGELSQKKEERVKVIEQVKPHLTTEIPNGPEKNRLQLLNNEPQLANDQGQIFPDSDSSADRDHERPFVASAGAKTEKDQYKGKPNQDSHFSNPDKGAFGVFDGLGGWKGGDEASQAARDSLDEALTQIPDGLTVEETEAKVREAMEAANAAVFQHTADRVAAGLAFIQEKEASPHIMTDDDKKYIAKIRKNAADYKISLGGAIYELEKIATTASVVKVWKDSTSGEHKAIIGNVGDSRVYHQHDGKMDKVTLDDTQLRSVFDETEAKSIEDDQANTDYLEQDKKTVKVKVTSAEQLSTINDRFEGPDFKPFRMGEERKMLLSDLDFALMTQVMGDRQITPRIETIAIEPGDRLLLTSDGIHDNLKTYQIQQVLMDNPDDTGKAATTLIQESQKGGKPDDMTVVVVNI